MTGVLVVLTTGLLAGGGIVGLFGGYPLRRQMWELAIFAFLALLLAAVAEGAG